MKGAMPKQQVHVLCGAVRAATDQGRFGMDRKTISMDVRVRHTQARQQAPGLCEVKCGGL
jgi:hypothetical protein